MEYPLDRFTHHVKDNLYVKREMLFLFWFKDGLNISDWNSAKRGTDVIQIHRGELAQLPQVLDYSQLSSSIAELHPLYGIPLCGIITPQKMLIKPIRSDKKVSLEKKLFLNEFQIEP